LLFVINAFLNDCPVVYTIEVWSIGTPYIWCEEERRNRQDLIEVFKMFRGFSKVSLQELFMLDVNSKGTTGHSCKLVKTRCTRDITKYCFSNKVINRWNSLDQRDGGCF